MIISRNGNDDSLSRSVVITWGDVIEKDVYLSQCA
jgi:hypothetical protein